MENPWMKVFADWKVRHGGDNKKLADAIAIDTCGTSHCVMPWVTGQEIPAATHAFGILRALGVLDPTSARLITYYYAVQVFSPHGVVTSYVPEVVKLSGFTPSD